MRRTLLKINQNIGNIGLKYLGEERTTPSGKRRVKTLCNCGNIFIGQLDNIKRDRTISCGCTKRQKIAKLKTTHGDGSRSNTHYLYRTWCGIKNRCTNQKRRDWKNYGGRGINICPEWADNYIAFKEYILNSIGERPKGYSIDRINNDGNYEPNNIRWADIITQRHNRRVACKI